MKAISGFRYKDLGPDGGPFDQFENPKVVIHTTQGSSISGAESAFRNYPPHAIYDPRNRARVQYVSLDRHSYALRNSEAEDDFVIQFEIVGFAESTHKWPDEYYRNFAADVIVPMEQALAVPRRHMRFYGADEGIVLASRHSPVRLSNAAWRAYSGWLGHQHSPNPDEHWDPGRFLMDKAFSFVPGKTPKKEDPIMFLVRERDKPEVWIGDYVQRRWVATQAEVKHLEARFGATSIIDPGTAIVFGEETAESKARRTGTGGPL